MRSIARRADLLHLNRLGHAFTRRRLVERLSIHTRRRGKRAVDIDVLRLARTRR